MPYLAPDRIHAMDTGSPPRVAGELNYIITKACIDYVEQRALDNQGIVNYEILNSVVGAMESAKSEFERRVVQPYENKKIRSNGDVFRKLVEEMRIF